MSETAEAETPAFGPGHNRPPEPLTVEQVKAHLTDGYGNLAKRQKDLIAAISRFVEAQRPKNESGELLRDRQGNPLPPVIDSAELQGKAADFVKLQLNGFVTRCVEAHKKEKDPYLEGGRAVDKHFRDLREPIEDGAKVIKAAAIAYAIRIEMAARNRLEAEAAEKQRLADEEVARVQAAMAAQTPAVDPSAAIERAQEAAQEADRAAAAAAAKPTELTRTRGDFGATFSATAEYEYVVEQPMLFLRAIIDGRAPISCITWAHGEIKKAIKVGGGKPIDGLKITETRKMR